MPFRINTILLFVSFFASIPFIKRNRQKSYCYFPAFLLISSIVEIIGVWMKTRHQNNILLYNLFSIFEFLFYLQFLLQLIDNNKIKNILRISIIILPLLCLLNIFFIQGPHSFHTITFILGSSLIDVFGILYLIQLFNNPDELALTRTPSFWMVIGILFFYISTPSFLGVLNYAASLPRIATIQLTHLLTFVDSMLYTLFIIAFLCRINIRKYISSF